MPVAVHIFTRDLRVVDNNALNQLTVDVYPVFIFTPNQIDNNKFKSNNAIQFMIESLHDLNNALDKKLGLFYGEFKDIVRTIIKKRKPSVVSITKDYTPYAVKRENDLIAICKENKIEYSIVEDYCLNTPGSIKLYQKFTPYKTQALKNIKPIPKKYFKRKFINIVGNFSFSDAEKLYQNNPNININGGRENALKQLKKIKDQQFYDETRNDLTLNTSELSAFIKFGCLSIREVYNSIKNNVRNASGLISQLIWRDFYLQLGFGFPHVLGKALKVKYNKIIWENDNKKFKKWKEGMTGFPIVDAGMRQLNETGYMHNRARLITASFLVKSLLIDWKLGEKYYATKLYDYDPLINNGNWQWVSSSGADSQPYFRIFNPWLQSKKHDPDCLYIKKWVPELKNVEPKVIHNWYKFFNQYNIYIHPIVEFSEEKKKALNMYKKVLKYD